MPRSPLVPSIGRSRLPIALVALLAIGAGPVVTAQDLRPPAAEALQAALEAVVESPATPFRGAVLAVGRPGEPTWTGAAGVADLESLEALTPDARFRAGSIAKPFAATVALQLVEEGAFGLEDPVRGLLDAEVADRLGLDERITLRMLLNHTSGIPDWIDEEVIGTIAADIRRVWDVHEFLDLAAAKPRTFQPGTAWSYSNTNYNLIELIIEHATGRDWRAEVTSRVLGPLGMVDTVLPDPGDVGIAGAFMHGYGLVDGALIDLSHVDPSMAGAAGGGALVTTAADLTTFLDALLTGGLFRDPATLAAMTEFVDAPYAGGQVGYGLGLQQFILPDGSEAIGHGGSTAGYFAFVLRFTDLDLTMGLAVDADVDPSPIIFTALRVLTALPGPAAAPAEAMGVTTQLLEAFESEIQEAMRQFGVPGAAVAIVEGGETVYAQGFGVRDLASGQPVTTDTLFRIGSLTKSMTSMMIATLVDEGRLDWDARVVDIVPTFALPTAELTTSVTVRELMGMGTGLGSPVLSLVVLRDTFTPTDLLAALATFPIVAQRGAWVYNNQVYAAAAYVAATAAGAADQDLLGAYEALMDERVFSAIGMSSAGIVDDPSLLGPDHARSYGVTLAGGPDVLEEVPVSASAADAPSGGAVASLQDMIRYLTTQLARGVSPDGVQVVSTPSLLATWEPQTQIWVGPPWVTLPGGYGMGWITESYRGVDILWHQGGIDGFQSELAMLPTLDVGIVVLTNGTTGESLATAMRYRLIELLHGIEPGASAIVAAAFEQQRAELATLATMIVAAPSDGESVGPYLGEYEHGWRLEQRADGGLWLLRSGWALRVVPTPDGYVVGSSAALGARVDMAVDENGRQRLALSFGDDRAEVAKLP
jgi:D-alanyl-D-alanine carboxypeptidase